jgi:hypothetical protein
VYWTLRYRDAEDMAPERRLGAWPAGSEIWTQLVWIARPYSCK